MDLKIKYLQKHKRFIGILLTIILLLTGLLVILSSQVESNRISPKGLEGYAIEYQTQYERLYYENKGLIGHLTDLSNFTFFWLRDYTITGVISTTHGAALSFDPLKRNPDDIYKEISEPIEYYFWPKMAKDIQTLPTVLITEGDYYLDSTISGEYGLFYAEPGANMRFIVKEKTFNLTVNAAITVFGSVIQEHSLLLKGSNDKEDWSIAQAGLDALSEFVWDLKSAGVDETAIRNVETRYKLPFVLSKISIRMEKGEYRENPALFYSDYEELKSAAAGTMNETLQNVLSDFYQNQQEEPATIWEKANAFFTQNTLGVAILSFVVGIVSTLVAEKVTKRRAKRKN